MSAVSWLSCSQYIKRCFVHSSLESSALCQAASISQSSAGPTSQRGAAPLPEIQKFPKFWGGPDADRDGCMRDSCSPKRRRGKGTACPSAPAALCHSSTGSGLLHTKFSVGSASWSDSLWHGPTNTRVCNREQKQGRTRPLLSAANCWPSSVVAFKFSS